jgi:5-formyltetrahydrofolate cyclo-ligase
LDFVITPLVAFDDSCNRIGVGGGFYDRTFEFLKHSESDVSQVALVGFAFELQRVDVIQINDWDVPLVAVATESGVYGRKR